MEMSISIVGIRDLDATFAKMAAVKVACDAAGVEYPDSVVRYFGGASEAGETIGYHIQKMRDVDIQHAIRNVSEDGSKSQIVDLDQLPADVKAIRFTQSW